jgi:hypothetical protein
VLDGVLEPIRLALVRLAVAGKVEGDQAPARIERLELRDGGTPGRGSNVRPCSRRSGGRASVPTSSSAASRRSGMTWS